MAQTEREHSLHTPALRRAYVVCAPPISEVSKYLTTICTYKFLLLASIKNKIKKLFQLLSVGCVLLSHKLCVLLATPACPLLGTFVLRSLTAIHSNYAALPPSPMEYPPSWRVFFFRFLDTAVFRLLFTIFTLQINECDEKR